MSNNNPELPKHEFAFSKMNYLALLIGVLVIILGFVLMSGGGSDDPTKFSEEIFSTRRITVAPIVVLLGYGTVMYSIFAKPKGQKDSK